MFCIEPAHSDSNSPRQSPKYFHVSESGPSGRGSSTLGIGAPFGLRTAFVTVRSAHLVVNRLHGVADHDVRRYGLPERRAARAVLLGVAESGAGQPLRPAAAQSLRPVAVTCTNPNPGGASGAAHPAKLRKLSNSID
ncbi:hypothetical protein GCM10009533_15960 [Saccharopolyspora spinosporotrichia]|uniref:Uncharacterized protein n=1 Tax=Saccharopolyspora erythraea TaxID=1836 RepID=A0ABP3MC94_SACER